MAAPAVYLKEQDKSLRVPESPGLYAAIVVDTERGPLTPTLITNVDQLLKTYTATGKLRRGGSNALLSAMQFLTASNKLWVARAIGTGYSYAGLLISYDSGTDTISFSTASATDPANFTNWGSNGKLFLAADSPGGWANGRVAVQFTRYTRPLPAGANSRAFVLHIYFDNIRVEEHLVSLWQDELDGNGKSIFIETVLRASGYLRAKVNPTATTGGTASQLIPTGGSGPWPTVPSALGNGANGNAPGQSAFIAAANRFANKLDYPVTLFLDGGYADPAYAVALTNLAETRRDAVAILSVPSQLESSANYLNDVISYSQSPSNGIGGINSSYSALYSPGIKLYVPDFDDYVFVSPDGFVASAIAKTAENYEIWMPVGGWIRGKLNVVDVLRNYTDGELDALYDANINPIRFKRGKGISIWGQKTLYRMPSALDRLNVRLLLITIENAIAESLEGYLFEQNTASTRSLIQAMIEGYMSNIQSRNGVYDFLVVCDESNNSPVDIDNYRLNVDLYIKPVKAIEYIHFRTVIAPTGVSFDLVRG